jgi:hypothetical protein
MRTSTLSGLASLLIVLLGGGLYLTEYYPRIILRSVLDQSIAALPPGTTASYQDARYSLITRQARIEGMTLHGAGDTAPYDLTISAVRSAHPNLQLPETWAKAVAAGDVNQAVDLADDIVLEGVALKSPTVEMTAETIHLAHPRAFPAMLPADIAAAMRRAMDTAVRQGPPSPEALAPLLRLEAAIILGIAHDGYDATGVKVTARTPEIQFAYAIQALHGGGMGHGRSAGGTLDHITMTSPTAGTFSVDKVSAGAMDLSQPLIRLTKGEPVSRLLLDGIDVGKIDYTGMIVHPPGQDPIEVGAMSLGPVRFAQGLPVAGTLGWKDVKVTKARLPDLQARMAFEAMGLESATISLAAAYDWDVTRRRLTVHDTALAINELGTLSLTIDLDGVDSDPMVAMTSARLVRGKLRFDDASLTDRLVKMAAEMQGADPAGYRGQIAAIIKLGALGGEPGSLMANLGGPAEAFLTAPRSLTLEMAPAAPLPLLTLRDQVMAAVLAPNKPAPRLGISAVANAP